jgi:hypothetical protein
MAPKIELQVNCPLSTRQKILYASLQSKMPSRDEGRLFEMLEEAPGYEILHCL